MSVTQGNSRLNARNAFDSRKSLSSSTDLFGSITPPKLSKHTSLSLSFSKTGARKTQPFTGIAPNQIVTGNRESDIKTNYGSINLYQSLPKGHLGFLRYSVSTLDGSGLGLTGLDLAERAYLNRGRIHNLRYSQSGAIKDKYNHFRLEFSKSSSVFKPVSKKPAILILGASNAGGAGNESESDSWRVDIANIITFDHKRHLLKIGGEFSRESLMQKTSSNLNGTYTFSNLAGFNSSRPLLFTQRLNGNQAKLSQTRVSIFFQDYIRLVKNFQAGIGLRYEWQNTHSDFDNFAPRLNLVWSPFKSSRFTIQAGFGIVYQWLGTSDLLTIENESRIDLGELLVPESGFPNSAHKCFGLV